MTLLFWAILFASFAVKIPAFFHPLVGHFGSYQAMIGIFGKMLGVGGTLESWLIPRTYILIDGQFAAHPAYYPFSALAAKILHLLMGGNLACWGRIQAALAMLGAAFFLYQILKRLYDDRIACLSTFIFSFAPMTLLSGISFQNEAIGLFFLLASFYFLLSPNLLSAVLSGILFSAMLLSRLHFIVVLPALIYFAIAAQPQNRMKRPALFLFFSFLPVILWYAYAYRYEQNHPGLIMTSLFQQSGEGRFLMSDFFARPDFYFRVLEILFIRLVTPLMIVAAAIGILRKDSYKFGWLLWTIASLSIIVLLPRKTADHPFYLITLVPVLSFFAARGMERFAKASWIRPLFLGLFVLLSMRLFAKPALAGLEDARLIPAIGKKVQEISKPGDIVIAQHGTSADLLYYCDRPGWSFDLEMRASEMDNRAYFKRLASEGYGDPVLWLQTLAAQGGDYFVISEPEKFQAMPLFYEFVTTRFRRVNPEDKTFFIYDLKEKTE